MLNQHSFMASCRYLSTLSKNRNTGKFEIMKKIYILFLLLVGSITNAQVVFASSLAEAFKKAKEQNKPVFVEYFNSDCSVCKRLQGLLLENDVVIDHYNANYINYAMNTYDELSKEDAAFMAKANLYFESVPVLLYFDKNKNFLHHSSGEINAIAVVNEAKKAVLSEFNSSGLKKKYASGDRSVRTLYAYCDVLKINQNHEMLIKVAQELFISFNKSELPTKKSYIILKQVVTSSENGFFQYWIKNLENLKGFEKGINEGSEMSYLQSIVLKELSDADRITWNASKVDRYKDYILKLKISENPGVFFQ